MSDSERPHVEQPAPERVEPEGGEETLVVDAGESRAASQRETASDGGHRGIVPFRPLRSPRLGWLTEQGPEDADEPLPERYEIRDHDGDRFLRCPDAPALRLRLDRGYAFSEADARRLGEQTILLDGAGAFPPTLDDARQLYNLDHHDGCLRAFTLATCEQALVLVLKGLELERGAWNLYANEPDLDTLFAIWVLLNHRRLEALRPAARDRLLPLLRLEGAIDANGLEVAEFCGLPNAVLATAKGELDRLHRIELELKQAGDWSGVDLLDYTRRQLGEIDRLVYSASDLKDFARVEEEYDHVEICKDKVAVICRDASGIFEVEKRLKAIWGERLGVIVLEKEPGHFTVRRSAALAGIDLRTAFHHLNLHDPEVDGRPPGKRWGGSDEIGGSPRPTGSRLGPDQIRQVLHAAYRPVTRWQKAKRLALLGAVSAALALSAGLGHLLLRPFFGEPPTAMGAAASLAILGLWIAATTAVLSWNLAGDQTRLFGWRRPTWVGWWPLAPVVVAGSAMTGAWLRPASAQDGGAGLAGMALAALVVVLLSAAGELWFRGLVHGGLLGWWRVQLPGGPWRLSLPTWVAALFSTAVLGGVLWSGVLHPVLELPSGLSQWGLSQGAALGSAFLAGLGLGMIRERSLSLLPGTLLQALGWFGALLLAAA